MIGVSSPAGLPVTILTVVYDTVAEAITGPVVATPSVGVAVRMLQDVARDERSAIHAHPGDYQLIQVGELVGLQLRPCEPRVLVTASDLLDAPGPLDRGQMELMSAEV